MRIVALGATGNVDHRVAAEALSRGHDVTAVVRDPDKSEKSIKTLHIRT